MKLWNNKIKTERTLRAAWLLLALGLLLSGCGRHREDPEEGAGQEETEDGGEETDPELAEEYPGTVAARDGQEEEPQYYGIMYATVLDVNGSGNDSSTIYSFKDKNDPDNAWSVSGLEVGDIEVPPEAGLDVVILFHGDMIRNSENVEFLVILPDGHYELKRAAGVTTSNMMNSFTLQTESGEEIVMIKDNCKIDEGAISGESGDRVVVYYADGGELGCYPLRVYKGN